VQRVGAAPEQLGQALSAVRRRPAVHPGPAALGASPAARVDALGAEADEDVVTDDQAALLERPDELVPGGPDVAGRRQDDRLPRGGVLDDRLAREITV
jgi:hypothetical protein